MISRNVRNVLTERRCRCFPRLDLQLLLHRLFDLLLVSACLLLVLSLALLLWNLLAPLLPAGGRARKNGRIVQFFFLGGGQSLRGLPNPLDPDDALARFRGDKIQLQEKIRWKDFLLLAYRSLLSLFLFHGFSSARRTVWRCMEELSARICSFFGRAQSIRRRIRERCHEVSRTWATGIINLI